VPRSPSSILFGCILAFAIALVGWWTLFLWRDARALAVASRALAEHQIDAAAQALGASDAAGLAAVAERRQAMFVSEGLVFALILGAGGALFYTALRREARLRQNQDHFLAGATHELKTPLATIRLLLESLRDQRLPADKLLRYLQSGLLETERLERGLTNVLTAAGLRMARGPVRFVDGDLATDVQQALAAMQPRAEAAGVELHVEPMVPVIAARDPEALQLVLRNLLDNAVKYSDRGTRVVVSLTTAGSDAVLAVRDAGRGMDHSELQHAFTPFWRGKDAATGGVGLGLHLVRQLVQAHGGSVTAASAGADRGSTFTVMLPCRGTPA